MTKRISVGQRVIFKRATHLLKCAVDPRVNPKGAFTMDCDPMFENVSPETTGTVIHTDSNIYGGSIVVYVELDNGVIIREYGRFSYKKIP